MRTYLVTGAASGIGLATADLLRQRGHKVIGADLRGAEIECNLADPAGRRALAEQTAELSRGHLDAVIAVAGIAAGIPKTVAVNYFGMVASLEGARPLLAASPQPRAVGVSSNSSLQPFDPLLVELMLADKEEAALARAAELEGDPTQDYKIYGSTKRAFSRWIRLNAARDEWAGQGIPLNAIAPGPTTTPLSNGYLSTPEGRERAFKASPMPLNGPVAQPMVHAYLLAWLASEENTNLCGQTVFSDGGFDVLKRGDSTW
ncbi:MAG: SDR family oxidoreductase [Bifidobacteriaceae bacterium]|jgi:NAD(P)-dependent dehydrogenase (short-subunit alcohol dehydrogenase family)|nr:SDR family oxidoreductase [Bifidobacteriaceae bacterium]